MPLQIALSSISSYTLKHAYTTLFASVTMSLLLLHPLLGRRYTFDIQGVPSFSENMIPDEG